MSLPTSINTVYAPGSQIKSADLNALQQEIVALQNGGPAHVGVFSAASAAIAGALTAASVALIGALTAASATLTGALNAASGTISGNLSVAGVVQHPPQFRAIPISAGSGAIVPGDYWQASGGGSLIGVPIVLNQGERLLSVRFRVKPIGTGGITCSVRHIDPSGVVTIPAQADSSGTAVQTVTVGGLNALYAGTHDYYNAYASAAANGDKVYGILAEIDVP